MPYRPPENLRQSILAAARRLGLLPWLERLRFHREAAKWRYDNAAFMDENPVLILPHLWWMHDMYAHCSYRLYWQTGVETAAKILDLASRHARSDQFSISEWGCGMGRVLRHIPPTQQGIGFDYNLEAIGWCKENLPGHWQHNQLMPPLAIEDNSLDVVYAISVFTHLSANAHHAWVSEMMRVIKPGGLFIATFHGAPKAGQLLPREQAAFDAGNIVVRGGVKEGSRIYTAYHPRDFVEQQLFAEWEKCEGPISAFGQTLYVMRKPEVAL